MKTLAVDTSTAVTAVACLDGDRVLFEDVSMGEQRHGDELLPRIQRGLAEAGLALAGLDLLAVGLGPGSFTGLRVGLATVKGLALGQGTPVRGVGSLLALAHGLGTPGSVVAVMDAHRGEVFVAVYDLDDVGGSTTLLAPMHAPPEQAAGYILESLHGRTAVLVGEGLAVHGEALAGALGDCCRLQDIPVAPSPAWIGRLGQQLFKQDGPSDLAKLEPTYLRDSDAKLPKRALQL